MNNTLLVEQSTQDFQTALKEKREILIADIEKEQNRIAEFDQCGDFNAVKSYVADCTGIQKRLVQYERNIEAINKEERQVSYLSELVQKFPTQNKITELLNP